MTEKNYLSEEELEKLISDVEEEKLLSAPPGILEGVLSSIGDSGKNDSSESIRTETKDRITEIQRPPETVDFTKKKTEFRRYCFRVISSMAAAIALLVFMPGISGIPKNEIPSKASVLSEGVKPREEVVGNSEKSIIKTINESKVFSNLWNFDIFE